jgi:hypothetical protein
MPLVTDYLSSAGSSIARAEQKSMPGHKLHTAGLKAAQRAKVAPGSVSSSK